MAAISRATGKKAWPILRRRRATRDSVLSFMLLTIAVFCLASLILSGERLPDYRSYEHIYEIGGLNFSLTSTASWFVVVNQAGKSLGLDYGQFRSAILLASIGLLSISLLRIERWLRWGNIGGNVSNLLVHRLLGFVTAAALLVFLLEFFQIRIRAGLAVSLASFAFSLYLTARRPSGLWCLICVSVFLLLAYETHEHITLVVGYLLFAPVLFNSLYTKLRPLVPRSIARVITVGLAIAISFYCVFLISIGSEARGEHLSSPLNSARLVCISVVPLLVVGVNYLFRCRVRAAVRNLRRGSIQSAGRNMFSVAQRREWWITFSTVCYFALAFALLVMVAADRIHESGEAIVRAFTLSSVPAIFVILLGSNKYVNVWLYLLLINSLLFVRTLLLPVYSG